MSQRSISLKSEIETNAVVWPRYTAIVEPDLEIECDQSSTSMTTTSLETTGMMVDSAAGTAMGTDEPHRHLVHSFPLFLLSSYFQKSILFSNLDYRPFSSLKRLKLPFSCESVQELINFAYNSECSTVTNENYSSLVLISDFTGSIRMLDYLQRMDPNQPDEPVGGGPRATQQQLIQKKKLDKILGNNTINQHKTNGTTIIIDHLGANSNDQDQNGNNSNNNENGQMESGLEKLLGKTKHRGHRHRRNHNHHSKHHSKHHHKHNHKNNHHHRRNHHRRQHQDDSASFGKNNNRSKINY